MAEKWISSENTKGAASQTRPLTSPVCINMKSTAMSGELNYKADSAYPQGSSAVWKRGNRF